jgi:hypothetical protein
MKSRQRSAVTSKLVKPLDAKTIDQLYDLEPVIDTENVHDGMEPTQFVTIACPYCGESYETRVDLTCGSFDYVEDCQICCQPIDLRVAVNDAGELIDVKALQLNA